MGTLNETTIVNDYAQDVLQIKNQSPQQASTGVACQISNSTLSAKEFVGDFPNDHSKTMKSKTNVFVHPILQSKHRRANSTLSSKEEGDIKTNYIIEKTS